MGLSFKKQVSSHVVHGRLLPYLWDTPVSDRVSHTCTSMHIYMLVSSKQNLLFLVPSKSLLTFSFPSEPPTASKKGESAENETEKTIPCLISMVNKETRKKQVGTKILIHGSYSIWLVCSNPWWLIVWKIPKFHTFIPRSRSQKLHSSENDVNVNRLHYEYGRRQERKRDMHVHWAHVCCMIWRRLHHHEHGQWNLVINQKHVYQNPSQFHLWDSPKM